MTTERLKIEGLGTYEFVINEAGEITKVVWIQFAARGEIRIAAVGSRRRNAIAAYHATARS